MIGRVPATCRVIPCASVRVSEDTACASAGGICVIPCASVRASEDTQPAHLLVNKSKSFLVNFFSMGAKILVYGLKPSLG